MKLFIQEQIRKIVKGQAEPILEFFYMICLGLVFTLFIAISGYYYEGGYYLGRFYVCCFSLRNNAISNLGNPNLNPRGWPFFSIGIILAGLMLIPHLQYINRHFSKINLPIAYVTKFLLGLAVIGMIGVGFADENQIPSHYIFAVFVFGGVGLAMICVFFYFIWRIMKKQPNVNKKLFGIIYIIVFITCIWLVSQVILLGTDDPRKLHLMEWVTFFLLLFWLVVMTWLVLDEGATQS